MTSSIPLPFSYTLGGTRAYRRTYTDVGYEGFFNREIIGLCKPPRSLQCLPFFLIFYLTARRAAGRPNMWIGKELQTKKISANNSINIAYASNEYKLLFYRQLRLTHALGFAIIRVPKWLCPLCLYRCYSILLSFNQLLFVNVFFCYHLYTSTVISSLLYIELCTALSLVAVSQD